MRHLAAFALVTTTAALAHANTWAGVAVFDDHYHLAAWDTLAQGLNHTPYRPLFGLTLALNYKISGLDLWSYHALQLIAHVFAATCLYGIIVSLEPKRRAVATVAACIFAAHWVSVDVVTYITQRCEGMATACIFAAVFCYARNMATDRGAWLWAATAWVVVGLGFKPIALTAFGIMLFIHHQKHGGGIVTMYRRQGWWLSWVLILGGWVLYINRWRVLGYSHVVGIEAHPLADYWTSQCRIMFWYLRRAFIPEVVAVEPGLLVRAAYQNSPWVLAAIGAAITAAVLLDRRKWLGVLIWSSLAILSVTAIIPIKDPAWSYRVYGPSAAASVVLAWLAVEAVRCRAAQMAAIAAVMMASIWTTNRSAMLYHDDMLLWTAATRYAPHSFRSWYNLGYAAYVRHDYTETIRAAKGAIDAKPSARAAHRLIADAYLKTGQFDKARVHLTRSVKMRKWGS